MDTPQTPLPFLMKAVEDNYEAIEQAYADQVRRLVELPVSQESLDDSVMPSLTDIFKRHWSMTPEERAGSNRRYEQQRRERTMTVRELIEELSEMDPDAPVETWDIEGLNPEVGRVETTDDGYVKLYPW